MLPDFLHRGQRRCMTTPPAIGLRSGKWGKQDKRAWSGSTPDRVFGYNLPQETVSVR